MTRRVSTLLGRGDSGETHGLPLRTSVAFASLMLALLAAPSADAQEPPPQPPQEPAQEPTPTAPPTPTPTPERDSRDWHPKNDFHTSSADWVVTGVAGATVLGSAIVAPMPKHPTGGVLYDEGVRDALRLKSRWWRYTARDFSDVGVSLETTWPFLVDALVTTWYWRGNARLARDIALVDAEAFAIAAAVQGWTNTLVSRERPYARLCGSDIPDASVDCDGNVRYRSFFSGHSTLSFTAAALMCSQHMGMELLGSPWDAVTCAGAFGVAATTATLRVMGDMHYATDVTVGSLVGTGVGFLIPWLHFQNEAAEVHVAPVGEGVGLSGVF